MGVQNELQAFRKEIPSSTTVHLMSASIDNFQHEWLRIGVCLQGDPQSYRRRNMSNRRNNPQPSLMRFRQDNEMQACKQWDAIND